MATITLTIDDATLAAMQSGEPVQLTAKLKVVKKREKVTPLTPEDATAFAACVEEWVKFQPAVAVGRAVKAMKTIGAPMPDVLFALDCALDWNVGREYAPEWFAKDFDVWASRARLDLFAAELDRQQYRMRYGL